MMVYFLSIIEQFNDGEQDDLAQYTIIKSFLILKLMPMKK